MTRHQRQAERQARPSARAAGAPYQSKLHSRKAASGSGPAAAESEGSSEEEEEELDFGWQRVYEDGELAGFVSPEGILCWTWEEVNIGMVDRAEIRGLGCRMHSATNLCKIPKSTCLPTQRLIDYLLLVMGAHPYRPFFVLPVA